MKITTLTTFVVPPRWLFLKIETDAGITGWGEPMVEGRAETVAALVAELADYLIGKDPSPIEDHWTVLYRGGFYRGGAIHMSALAGIDQALWDIKGKALGQPVHALLGGPVREKMRVYSWIGGDRPAELVEGAQGSRGARLYRHQDAGDGGTAGSRQPRQARRGAGAGRGACARRWGRISASRWISMAGCTGPMAKVLAKELDPFQLMFIEEPVLSEHVEALREIANHTATPIALGERLFSRWDFKTVLQRRAGGHHPARSLPCRRHHRDPQDRGHGGSL